MDAAVIDGQFAVAVLAVDLDEAVAESEIAPGIVLLCLDGGGDNRIDSDNRYKKQSATGF